MTSLQEFRCEVCGLIATNPTHWFVIRCGDSDLTVYRWNSETANAAGGRHYCGEGHAQVYISRWFESVCTPPKPLTRRDHNSLSVTFSPIDSRLARLHLISAVLVGSCWLALLDLFLG
jgi:hypothetical protein